MKNKEHFKDEICELACEERKIAINKNTNAPCDCAKITCTECALQKSCLWKSHTVAVREWCNAEYGKPSPFKRNELVEVSDDGINWRLRYFSCIDEDGVDGKFRTFDCGRKCEEEHTTSSWQYCRKYGTLGGLVKEN